MTHPLVAIEERHIMQKRGFKSFHTLPEAYHFIQKHLSWHCLLVKRQYDDRTVRYVVNYSK